MNYYLPPAGIDDFSRSPMQNELREKWNTETNDLLDYIMGLTTGSNGKKFSRASPLFYNQLADKSGIPDSAPTKIPWNAFPLRLQKWFNPGTSADLKNKMYSTAEILLTYPYFKKISTTKAQPVQASFRIQDEYCEWHVVSGEKPGSISKIYFTCEPPEYWTFIAKYDKKLLVTLYRELLHNENIQENELFWQHDVFEKTSSGKLERVAKAGDYNPNNKWNTTNGAIHLTHPANSLNAEMVLASDGTLGWPVKADATGRVDIINLMCCAGVGGINRSSDPLILRGVFEFAKENNCVALANPIGLYMMPFQIDLLDPNDNQIGDVALKVIRASADKSKWLRVEISVPENANYTLDQCILAGKKLSYGGQIAEGITMGIFGVAKKIPGKIIKEVGCNTFCCDHPQHPLFKGTFGVRSFKNCADVTADDWASEAFDIPDDNKAKLKPVGNELKLGIGDLEAHSEEFSTNEFAIELTDVENTTGIKSFHVRTRQGRGVVGIGEKHFGE